MKYFLQIPSFCLAALLCCMTATFAACDPVNEPVERPSVDHDTTDVYLAQREAAAYSLFFKPSIAWIGDVMPFYDSERDEFHIFYLQDWRPSSGIIHPIWDVITSDFATFGDNFEAIPVGADYEQDMAIGTGGCMRDQQGLYHFFYTGEKYNNPDARQAVMHATSTDLRHWTKDRAFGYLKASDGYDAGEFRDPCVFFDEEAGLYRMVLATHYMGRDALGHYTSTDLVHWSAAEPLLKEAVHFMECPDMFRMGDYWYLTYSSVYNPRCVYYRYKQGSLASAGGWSDPIPLDGHAWYAAKTCRDKQGRRFIAGWLQTLAGNYDSSGWGGALVAHQLVQEEGSPLLHCVDIEARRARFTRPLAKPEAFTLTADTARAVLPMGRMPQALHLECDVRRLAPATIFGIGLCTTSDEGNPQYLRFLVEPENNKADLVLDSEQNGQLNYTGIHSLLSDEVWHISWTVEQSVAVLYINDRVAFSCRIYDMPANPWQFFCERGAVEVTNLHITTF